MDLSAYLSAQRFLGRNLRVRTRISEGLRPFYFSLTMKKILLLFLCILSFNATYADVTWNLSDDGTLTISGTGDMENYLGLKGAPWCEQKNNIKTVVIENGVTSIGDNAFLECQNMVSVTIPNSVTVIGIQAFYHCTSLASIKFPKFLRTIQIQAFSGCSCLTSITIPKSVQYIKEASFSHCSGLVSIEVEEGNKKYDSRNNCNAIIETSSNSLIVGCSNTIIPNSITSIGASAFSGCTRLASVIIPNSVTNLGDDAFAYCKGLTSITIPKSINIIGDEAFYGCINLKEATIFTNNSLEIGTSVFGDENFAFGDWWYSSSCLLKKY